MFLLYFTYKLKIYCQWCSLRNFKKKKKAVKTSKYIFGDMFFVFFSFQTRIILAINAIVGLGGTNMKATYESQQSR